MSGFRQTAQQAATALHDTMVDRCLTGACWCKGAGKCVFGRCDNCDMPLDDKGRGVVQHRLDVPGMAFRQYQEDEYCPYCGSPLAKP